jgi:hypothetical protein
MDLIGSSIKTLLIRIFSMVGNVTFVFYVLIVNPRWPLYLNNHWSLIRYMFMVLCRNEIQDGCHYRAFKV